MCCESRSNGKNKYSKHSESIIKPAAAGTVTSLLMRLHFKAMELTDTAHRLTTALDSLIWYSQGGTAQTHLHDWCLGLIPHLCEIQVLQTELQITFTWVIQLHPKHLYTSELKGWPENKKNDSLFTQPHDVLSKQEHTRKCWRIIRSFPYKGIKVIIII